MQWVRIQCCHCSGSGRYCDMGSIPGPGLSTCCGYSQRKKKKKKNDVLDEKKLWHSKITKVKDVYKGLNEIISCQLEWERQYSKTTYEFT